MKFELPTERSAGMVSAASAYILWGFLPIYWKLLYIVPSLEVLAHRVLWSVILMAFVLLIAGRIKTFLGEILDIVKKPKQLLSLVFASFFISVNWLTYIWAVANNHIVETSLGYYINPLVSVLFGILFLKEKLSLWQTVSFVLAVIGVLNMTLNYGSFPWIALVLAFSFGIYGLLKKMTSLGAISGLTSETLIITPFALAFLTYVHQSGDGAFGIGSPAVSGYLIGAGVVTAVPLLLFSAGAIRLPLSTVGFLQYIAPTIALVLGVLLYHEPFTAVHIVSFVFIWSALTIYSLSRTRTFLRIESVLLKAFKFSANT